MKVNPIKTRKIYEEVSDSLIELLKTGQLHPGDKLNSVEQLAKDYDVSRSAIREALSGLRAMGLVEMRQGEGTYITQFDASQFSLPVATALLMKRDDIKDLSEVRKILEVGSASSAAISHCEEDLLPMREALQAMKDAKGKGELGEKADLDFHLAIANATHNQMLISLMSSVSDIMVESMRETRRLILYSEERSIQLFKEHQRIFDAIEARDADDAQKAMLDHLIEVDRVLAKYIEKK
ncbi:HTH-type transcriptional regulator LutR [Lentibacillus populi]|uniref:HTH-type transcriptional regulator LutR n=1 Tax=Lentibacillus populi TaxID=1827502 RepID=A0A9W5X797_9BACI|nr:MULTISPECIES: FadR/GntR family transcriptional regulator [Bacillaceae]MBT2216041.1 FadR family transcriptional regulator [Virgibacillus dakarensis]GGB58555.1 HTH-type transcriptional regulator LutR [Lentibacillus populi]